MTGLLPQPVQTAALPFYLANHRARTYLETYPLVEGLAGTLDDWESPGKGERIKQLVSRHVSSWQCVTIAPPQRRTWSRAPRKVEWGDTTSGRILGMREEWDAS